MSDPSVSSISRVELRRAARVTRRALIGRTEKNIALSTRLIAAVYPHGRVNVHTYVSTDEEANTRVFLEWLLKTFGEAVVPIPQGSESGPLQVRIHSLEELEPGALGILEPKPEVRRNPQRVVAPSELQICVVPGLAFDSRGYRLGYGSGYYDRLLAAGSKRCLTVGLCYDCQLIPRVPEAPHDQPVGLIVTESQVLSTNVVQA